MLHKWKNVWLDVFSSSWSEAETGYVKEAKKRYFNKLFVVEVLERN